MGILKEKRAGLLTGNNYQGFVAKHLFDAMEGRNWPTNREEFEKTREATTSISGFRYEPAGLEAFKKSVAK